ncbi:MAG: hypothetical protein JRD92_16985 [Deltaproteobacteria bacterium]|nr:hypothetical protein [Deltaproteobacteria bacterium]
MTYKRNPHVPHGNALFRSSPHGPMRTLSSSVCIAAHGVNVAAEFLRECGDSLTAVSIGFVSLPLGG